MTEIERFMLRVQVSPTGCWLWNGPINPGGYGTTSFRGGCAKAHRVSYLLHRGEIPDGLQLDHLCRVRHCVNPDHLEPVTNQENASRGLTGDNHRSKTHCPKGHPYDEENTRLVPAKTGTGRQWRLCVTCVRAMKRESERRRRQRAAGARRCAS